MSKRAEEAERKYFGKLYQSQMRPERDAFIKGYEQAEKDLALTWEDIKTVCRLKEDVELDVENGFVQVPEEAQFKEVLRRWFNEQRKK